ncbi:MAG TPA: putative Ig domain-containing protein, partial [Anaerolineaceae bacterium]|nr:putative Ig domain-containing protein [Anaerolineaceae bacterium]
MRKSAWFGLITLLVFLFAGVLSSNALAQTGTTLAVNPTPAEARTCSTSAVAIRVADVANLTAFHLELSFDPTKIEVTAAEPGSFLIGPGETYLPEITNAINNTAGTVVWGLAKQGSGGNPNPVSGSGDILVLTIKAKVANATSALTIDGAKSMLVDWPEAQPIPFTDTDGTINTRSCAPTDISLSNASIAENQPGNSVVGSLSATDPDSADKSFTYAFADLAGHPDAAYFNINGSSLRTNIPFDYETKSSYAVRIKVTDPWGESYEENFTISVIDVNDAPVLAYIGNKAVDELAALSFIATATDADLPANALAFSLVGAPTGAAIDPATGAFTWTPSEAQGPGSYTFEVCVSDGALSDCETITVTVNEVNSAPVLSPIGAKDIEELVPFTFTAEALDEDIPAQTLSFSLEDGTAGDVPEGAAIDPATGAFTWTPTEAQGDGTYTFDVCVSDGALQDCETITIKVYEDLEVTNADLKVGTEISGPYTAIPGSFAAGYTLQLDPLEDWYYFDTDTITSNRPLANGSYPFYLQGSTTEVFTLVVNGSDYFLRDTYADDGTPLRVQGNWPLGSYTYVGEVADSFGFKDEVSLTITFVAPFAVTDADLKAGTVIGGPYSPLEGSFAAGFVMRLDPAVPWYYFDTDSITANRPLADGSYPFYLQGTPTEIFTLEVDGTNYWLRDTYKDDDTPLRIEGTYTLGTYSYEGLVADAYGYTAAVTIKITLIDGTIPVLELVTPPEGAVALSPKDTFVLTVDALDNNLFELEVDHSMEGSLPEFSVYADADNPYGSAEAAAQFAAMGVSVSYDATLQKWTIDFGEAVTDAFITNGGITFYFVLQDTEGNQWGTMYGTTPENTFVYTLTVTNTLEEEIASAPSYVYADGYVYVGDSVFEDITNTYTNTYSPAEFLAGAGMNDLARYLGALYRQSTSTVASLQFNGVTYTWNSAGTLKGSNWEDSSGHTLVSAMTAYYFSPAYDPAVGMTVTLNDGWHTATVTFKLVITNTLEEEIASAVSYEYIPPYIWSGDVVFTD